MVTRSDVVGAGLALSIWQGYRGGLLFYATSFGASLLSIDPSNERGVALFEALVHRTFTTLDDLDVGRDFGYDDSTSRADGGDQMSAAVSK